MVTKAKAQYWVYASWFNIIVRYRKTILGPLWLIAGPFVFIAMLGVLYASISNTTLEVFIPHLAIGIVVWSLITSLMNSGPNIITHNKPKIIHSGMSLGDLVIVNVMISFLEFLHYAFILIGVWFLFKWSITIKSAVSLIGLGLILINGVWYGVVFGLIGARYRDVPEIITALTGALFFVTPIIWMPSDEGRGGILGSYLTYNPFYHFLELIRAPILGNPIDPLSWAVVLSITTFGLITAFIFYKKFAHHLATWV